MAKVIIVIEDTGDDRFSAYAHTTRDPGEPDDTPALMVGVPVAAKILQMIEEDFGVGAEVTTYPQDTDTDTDTDTDADADKNHN